MQLLRPLTAAALALTLAACDPGVLGDPDATTDTPVVTDTPIDTRPSETCPVGNTAFNPSLVVNDPTTLARFGFARVMGQVLTTANVSGSQTARALYQQWMRTFGASPATGVAFSPPKGGVRFCNSSSWCLRTTGSFASAARDVTASGSTPASVSA